VEESDPAVSLGWSRSASSQALCRGCWSVGRWPRRGGWRERRAASRLWESPV